MHTSRKYQITLLWPGLRVQFVYWQATTQGGKRRTLTFLRMDIFQRISKVKFRALRYLLTSGRGAHFFFLYLFTFSSQGGVNRKIQARSFSLFLFLRLGEGA